MNGTDEKEPEIRIDEDNLTMRDLHRSEGRVDTEAHSCDARRQQRQKARITFHRTDTTGHTPGAPYRFNARYLQRRCGGHKEIPEVMALTIKNMIERAKEMQRESTSRIITP